MPARPQKELTPELLAEIERKYDPELAFRPTGRAISLVISAALVAMSAVSVLRVGLRPDSRTPSSRHLPGLHARAGLPDVLLAAQGQLQAGRTGLVPVQRRRDLRHRAGGAGRRGGALPAVALARRGVAARRQPVAVGHLHGQRFARALARGDAPFGRADPSGHRADLHGLRAVRAVGAGCAQAWRNELARADQPPVHDQPGHLRRRHRRHGAVRVPVHPVRRAGHANRPRAVVHRSRDGRRRALLGRAGEGGDLLVGADGNDLRLVDRQHGDHRRADDPGDETRRLSGAFRRRGGSDRFDRRSDHAADPRRGGLHHGRVPGDTAARHPRGRALPGPAALLRHLHHGAPRGEEARPARPARRRTAQDLGWSCASTGCRSFRW